MNIIFNIFFAVLLLNSPDRYDLEGRNKATIINIQGAKIYEKPTFDSNPQGELALGTIITIEISNPEKESITIGNGFLLSGNWIKPKGIEGYVFSADLTDKAAITGKNEFGNPYINLLGGLVKEIENTEYIETENGKFPKHIEAKQFDNGIYTFTLWDGCFDHVTEYKNLTLSEVYHQMISDYVKFYSGEEPIFPKFQDKTEHIIKFEAEVPTQDLQIEIKDDGTIVVSSYDCT